MRLSACVRMLFSVCWNVYRMQGTPTLNYLRVIVHDGYIDPIITSIQACNIGSDLRRMYNAVLDISHTVFSPTAMAIVDGWTIFGQAKANSSTNSHSLAWIPCRFSRGIAPFTPAQGQTFENRQFQDTCFCKVGLFKSLYWSLCSSLTLCKWLWWAYH